VLLMRRRRLYAIQPALRTAVPQAYAGAVKDVLVRGFVLAFIWVAVAAAQEQRVWKQGTWTEPPDARTYAIETATEIITARDPEARTARALDVPEGAAVSYVIVDAGRSLIVRDSSQTEHRLTLLGTKPKYSTSYAAAGGGHYIKSVAPGGASVTLEDGSRWDIDPMVRFSVADWESDDLVTVRRSTDDPAFAYEVDNTSRDDGALANYRAR
jgi:hypothetical protein